MEQAEEVESRARVRPLRPRFVQGSTQLIRALKSDLAARDVQINAQKKELDLKEKLLGTANDAIRRIEKDLSVSRLEIERLRSDGRRLSEEKNALAAVQRRLGTEAHDLKSKIERARKQYEYEKRADGKNQESLKNKLTELNEELVVKQRELTQNETDLADKERSMASLRAEYDAAQVAFHERINAYGVDAARLATERDAATSRLKRLTDMFVMFVIMVVIVGIVGTLPLFRSMFVQRKRMLAELREWYTLAHSGSVPDTIEATALEEYASHKAMIDEVRVMVVILLIVSCVGTATPIVYVCYNVVSGAVGDIASLDVLVGSTLWKLLLGFFAPCAAAVAVYKVVQEKLLDATNTCRELGLRLRALHSRPDPDMSSNLPSLGTGSTARLKSEVVAPDAMERTLLLAKEIQEVARSVTSGFRQLAMHQDPSTIYLRSDGIAHAKRRTIPWMADIEESPSASAITRAAMAGVVGMGLFASFGDEVAILGFVATFAAVLIALSRSRGRRDVNVD